MTSRNPGKSPRPARRTGATTGRVAMRRAVVSINGVTIVSSRIGSVRVASYARNAPSSSISARKTGVGVERSRSRASRSATAGWSTMWRLWLPGMQVRFGMRGRDTWVLVATIVGSSLAFIDGAVVSLALPEIQTEFRASDGDVAWIVELYTLVLGALM